MIAHWAAPNIPYLLGQVCLVSSTNETVKHFLRNKPAVVPVKSPLRLSVVMSQMFVDMWCMVSVYGSLTYMYSEKHPYCWHSPASLLVVSQFVHMWSMDSVYGSLTYSEKRPYCFRHSLCWSCHNSYTCGLVCIQKNTQCESRTFQRELLAPVHLLV